LELRDLSYFARVAAFGHVGRAAESLGLTQPALTKAIARLERELGARLLERRPKGVSVTVVGQAVLRRATQMQATMDDARREFASLTTGAAGHLRVGTGLAMAQYLVPAACARLLARARNITLDIVAGTGLGLLPSLREGHLDMVLSGLPPGHEQGLRREAIMEDEVVVIAGRSHPLHRRRSVDLAELARQRWIISKSGSLLADWLEAKWRHAGIAAPAAAVHTDSIATLLSLVASTDLITFHSWSTIRRSPLHAELRPLRSSPLRWRRRLGVTYREGGYLPPAGRQLIDELVALGRTEALAVRAGTTRSAKA
jgi:DNA-binding transcriptional LysR family regulator